VEVARDLVGALLVVDPGTPDEVRARIVEVEAYLGENDPASHAHRGSTPRSSIMFGPPGHLYVYFSYGMHHCANVVCGPDGTAAAVLLRAAAVESGERVVRDRRGETVAASRLLSGPGNLCRGLRISAADNGVDLCRPGRLWIQAGSRPRPLSSGPRVGISRAADLPLRFWWTAHPAVSARRSLGTKKGTGAVAGPRNCADLSRPPGA
jgi:DNA-3-methyladenine glycosylase